MPVPRLNETGKLFSHNSLYKKGRYSRKFGMIDKTGKIEVSIYFMPEII